MLTFGLWLALPDPWKGVRSMSPALLGFWGQVPRSGIRLSFCLESQTLGVV